MATFFLVCAVLGGAVLVLQLLLGLVGLGADAVDFDLGTDAEAEAAEALNLLSARAIFAGLAFFGVAGLVAQAAGLGLVLAVALALASGIAATTGVAALMRAMVRLQDDGTVRLDRSIGEAGTVYLSIPARRAGEGKVLLTLQNRTVECQAVTSLDELPTGTSIIVVDILGPDTVEVAPAPDLGGFLNAPA